ncbi:hypothetical protein MBM_03539 [Drepanopeziza brunnea f. sp. 'multigermtubi' MB_m1]|uniref:Uncharacterized protein n=2 Tax=Drepanopeziza brunnea f. sp. 'multigermtubi' TaxID=698441 RepID=K1WZZ6_MARBU|nr:uncharacterized protein MBM_03539 [Drepanopeziza brunnea f. sp. 'multigermtubi' MB_m1]EKD18546.1 hypothetical protein MBM_03539 [Drepanopeziza brunnea f. sp. 'multigermtubi' MB_m1]
MDSSRRQPAVQAGMPAGNSGFTNASFSETIHPGRFVGTWPRPAPPMGPATSQAAPQVAWNNMASPQGYPQTLNGATNYHFVPSAYAPPAGPISKHECIPGHTYHSASAPPNHLSPLESVSPTAPAGTDGNQTGVTPSKKPLIIELHNPTINPEFILAAGGREPWKFVEQQQQLDQAKIWEARSQDQQVILKIYNPVFTTADAATFAAPTTHDLLNTAASASASTATDTSASPTPSQRTDTARSKQTDDDSSPSNSPPPPPTPPPQHYIASSSSVSFLPQITSPTPNLSTSSTQDPPPPPPPPSPSSSPALAPAPLTDWNSLTDAEYWKRVDALDALDALKAQELNAISAPATDTREVEWRAQLDQAISKPQNFGYRSDDMEFSWEIDGDPDQDGPGYGKIVERRRWMEEEEEEEEEVKGGEGEVREGEGPKYDIEMNEVVKPVWYQADEVRNA